MTDGGVVEVRMPRLGDTVVEGTVVEWLVTPGETVEEGQPLLEISSDKVTTEYPSELSGELIEILAEPGATVPVGAPIARMRATAGGDIAAPAPPVSPAEPQPGPPVVPVPERLRPTGTARAAARVHGLPEMLTALPGSGRQGRVRLADVERALADRDAAHAQVSRPSPMRQVIAAHMARSWATAAHASVLGRADASALLAARRRHREAFRRRTGNDLTALPFIVDALARALGGTAPIGVAVDLGDGLVVPVARQAGQGWEATAAELGELVQRARTGALRGDDLQGGVSTITNVGVFGAAWCQPILNAGQATILGLGRIAPEPIVPEGGLAWPPLLPLSLVYDRHQLDEVAAAALLDRITGEIEHLPTAA